MDWSTRLHDTQILTTLNNTVIRAVIASPGDCEFLESVVLEYIALVTEIIDSEPGLIRSMFKPGSDTQGLIN